MSARRVYLKMWAELTTEEEDFGVLAGDLKCELLLRTGVRLTSLRIETLEDRSPLGTVSVVLYDENL